jgi:plastocyanin
MLLMWLKDYRLPIVAIAVVVFVLTSSLLTFGNAVKAVVNKLTDTNATSQTSIATKNTTSKPPDIAKYASLVEAGGGGISAVRHQFLPQKLEISPGQSVTWYNPSSVAEPHTVTFALDSKTTTELTAPFIVPNSTKFVPLPPRSNSQPMIFRTKDGINTVVGLNARVFNAVVIDSNENVRFLYPNAQYVMIGTEKYLNSGWLLPQGKEQSFLGSANTFTVTFKKPGTYNYICIIHPWMKGSIIVK